MTPKQRKTPSAAQQEFTEWFVKNYPGPDTIIHDPLWHAPKIYRAAMAWKNAGRATQDALEMENKELRQRIRQFEFCIGRVAIALGGVCCGGVDVTLQQVQADPHSTTRVLCDAIAALRPLRKEGK